MHQNDILTDNVQTLQTDLTTKCRISGSTSLMKSSNNLNNLQTINELTSIYFIFTGVVVYNITLLSDNDSLCDHSGQYMYNGTVNMTSSSQSISGLVHGQMQLAYLLDQTDSLWQP